MSHKYCRVQSVGNKFSAFYLQETCHPMKKTDGSITDKLAASSKGALIARFPGSFVCKPSRKLAAWLLTNTGSVHSEVFWCGLERWGCTTLSASSGLLHGRTALAESARTQQEWLVCESVSWVLGPSFPGLP